MDYELNAALRSSLIPKDFVHKNGRISEGLAKELAEMEPYAPEIKAGMGVIEATETLMSKFQSFVSIHFNSEMQALNNNKRAVG